MSYLIHHTSYHRTSQEQLGVNCSTSFSLLSMLALWTLGPTKYSTKTLFEFLNLLYLREVIRSDRKKGKRSLRTNICIVYGRNSARFSESSSSLFQLYEFYSLDFLSPTSSAAISLIIFLRIFPDYRSISTSLSHPPPIIRIGIARYRK